MTENDDLPLGWTVRPDGDQREWAIQEWYMETDTGTTFIVSILEGGLVSDLRNQSDTGLYELRLSTIAPHSTWIRHDFSVTEFETRDAAIEEAKAFIDHLSTELNTGGVNPDDPQIENIRRVIHEFADGSLVSRVRQAVRRLTP